MSNTGNVSNPVDEVAETNRAQMEHRATWMGLKFNLIQTIAQGCHDCKLHFQK